MQHQKITILIALLICMFGFSQTQVQSGQIVYKAELNNIIKDDGAGNTYLNDLIVNSNLTFKALPLLLNFNSKESCYQAEKMMEKDENSSISFGLTLINATGIVYVNKETKEIVNQLKAFGQNFLVTKKYSNDWKLGATQKMIGKYSCYKATKLVTVTNSKGDFTKEVVAWYCPAIPLNFGPAEFVGLPGLILEVTVEGNLGYTIRAEKITLDLQNTTEIKVPTKGKKVTEEELESIGEKLAQENKDLFKD